MSFRKVIFSQALASNTLSNCADQSHKAQVKKNENLEASLPTMTQKISHLGTNDFKNNNKNTVVMAKLFSSVALALTAGTMSLPYSACQRIQPTTLRPDLAFPPLFTSLLPCWASMVSIWDSTLIYYSVIFLPLPPLSSVLFPVLDFFCQAVLSSPPLPLCFSVLILLMILLEALR